MTKKQEDKIEELRDRTRGKYREQAKAKIKE